MRIRQFGWRRILAGFLILVASASVTAATGSGSAAEAPLGVSSLVGGAKSKSTADHSKFKELQGPFSSGPEVTKACLACHNEAAHQVMKSIHWTWETISPTTGKKLGKQFAANNFCGSVLSNEPRCTSCHAGYGWTDKNYDFTKQENVDCLASTTRPQPTRRWRLMLDIRCMSRGRCPRAAASWSSRPIWSELLSMWASQGAKTAVPATSMEAGVTRSNMAISTRP